MPTDTVHAFLFIDMGVLEKKNQNSITIYLINVFQNFLCIRKHEMK